MLGCWQPGHFCIDNAIHTFAGVQLRLECAQLMQAQGHEEPTGHAKITGGYNLPAKHVLHTVGPIYNPALPDIGKYKLMSSYLQCLDMAQENGLKSLAFCCISTGVFGYPKEPAAKVAVDTVQLAGWRQPRRRWMLSSTSLVTKICKFTAGFWGSRQPISSG